MIDFLHRSLNGCYSPICNSNEFHYKALEHTERETEMLADGKGERERGRGKRKTEGGESWAVIQGLSVNSDDASPRRLETQITAEQL